MTAIETQTQAQKVQTLEFCYLCGRPLKREEPTSLDHVPPKSLFAKEDRNFPIQLPTHVGCNEGESRVDEILGQLVSLLHGKVPSQRSNKLRVTLFRSSSSPRPFAAFSETDLHAAIFRWVRGFHAALYGEYLCDTPNRAVHPPFPFSIPTKNRLFVDEIKPQQPLLVSLIKKNRAAGKLDRIRCNNGKLRYECVWEEADDGTPMCAFALNVYDWLELGDIHNFPGRGCVGFYVPESRARPSSGTQGVSIEVDYQNVDPLDPFGG